MKKLRIAVLMGGESSEYAVSLKTGAMMAENLDRRKYLVKKILISRKGKWPISLDKLKQGFDPVRSKSPKATAERFARASNGVDLVLIAMHGEYGENGEVQNVLEKAGIKFSGSDSRASRIGMDKKLSAKIFRKAGLNVPENTKKIPLVVKPVDRGSSVGVSVVRRASELLRAIEKARACSKRVMMQKFIEGREFTCGVLEINKKAIALPPTEIIPKNASFFDFKSKYVVGGSAEITPPNLAASKIKILQKIALKAHKAVGCRGLSRTDVIMDRFGKFYVLEINTLPGMTATSLLPQQAKAAGISFVKLLDFIVEAGRWKLEA